MKRNLYLGTVAILLVLLVGAGYWYFTSYRPRQAEVAFQRYLEVLRAADVLHHEGRLDEAIAAFEETLRVAPTQGSQTYVKLKIAYDTYVRNQSDDRIRAVQMYKDIIMDERMYPFQRASALSDLLDLYYATDDEDFLRTAILRGEPFEKFIDEAQALNYSADLAYALRRAHEMGEELYPLTLAEFRIAGWYLGALGSGRATAAQVPELLGEARRWTELGEANMPVYQTLGFEKSKIGYAYQLNAHARRGLARYGDGSRNYALAEEAFQSALRALAPESEVHAVGIGMFVRFHYAAMLAEVYGESRRADIERLMREVAVVPAEFRAYSFPFYEFLENETSHEHDAHGHRQDLVRLSQMVPQFRTFLEARGIRY